MTFDSDNNGTLEFKEFKDFLNSTLLDLGELGDGSIALKDIKEEEYKHFFSEADKD